MVLEVKWEGEDSLSRPLELTLSGFKCKGKEELICFTFHLSTGFKDVSLIFLGIVTIFYFNGSVSYLSFLQGTTFLIGYV